MEIGFNGATTMKASLYEDIASARSAGFHFLEIRDNKLEAALVNKSLKEIHNQIIQSGLNPLALNSLEKANLKTGKEAEEIFNRARTLFTYCYELQCPILIVVPSFWENQRVFSKEEVIQDACRLLMNLEEMSRPFEVKIGFEFLGFDDCSINSLSLCNKIIRQVNNPNVGLVIDTFHFYLSNEPLTVLREVDPDTLLLVHISDAEKRPRNELKDEQRLLPGDGVIPLKDIIEDLTKIGFSGSFSIELFNPELWEMHPDEVAKICYSRLKDLFS